MKHRLFGEDTFLNIENVVASARLDENINLDLIARLFPKPEYPEQFPGLVLRIEGRRIWRERIEEEEWEEGEREGIAVLIFDSGKMVLTGARSEREARNALSGMINQLSKAGIVTSRKLDIEIQDIVASAALGGPVDLEKAACCHRRVMYEPEQFPGLIYRMEDPASIILLFASGKLVCTGTKTEPEVLRAVMKLKRLLQASQSSDDQHTVDVLDAPNAIPVPKASLEAIRCGVKGKALERMMKEAVECPVKAKRVSFVACFTCANFNRRIKGKVGCAGLPGVGPREEEEEPEGNAEDEHIAV
jgi:transcription initiation factor TFIID TATA-box-binding protein